MKRFAEKNLFRWLEASSRKPLVIRGARQVGKSTLVRQSDRGSYSLIFVHVLLTEVYN
ncbi:MAG: hypothetical protein KAR40_08520 [Candidatus Sabulitectum sp.]|nr:hypothetical protein [Candidatus Sabulitectum sp.]